MPKKKNPITILAIGEVKDHDSFRKFHKEKKLFRQSGFDYQNVSYQELLRGKLPPIKTKKVIIFLFFPFFYWNKYIEHKNYPGLYGNHTFFIKFMRLWKQVDGIIKRLLDEKDILFINHPLSCGLYRDKLNVVKKLSRFRIPQPQLYRISSVRDMRKKLREAQSFFIKPRYGSMGKGITFLSWPNWQTNFIFKNNKIISKRSDHGWKFREITNNSAFLGKLLKKNKDILIEQALEQLSLGKMKVDLRVYTFFKKVIYIYPRRNSVDKVTTNISQGGRGDPNLLPALPQRLLTKAKRIAQRISRTLNLNFTGMDIILDKNLKDIYVIDVNTFPGFPKRRTFNLTQELIKELIKLRNKGKI